MSTATIAARATDLEHAPAASARPRRISAHAAVLVWTALFAAYGARVAFDTGPAHRFQLTFFNTVHGFFLTDSRPAERDRAGSVCGRERIGEKEAVYRTSSRREPGGS